MPSAMSTLLTGLTDLTTAILGVAGSVIDTVIGEPLLLIPVFMGLMISGVAFVKSFR